MDFFHYFRRILNVHRVWNVWVPPGRDPNIYAKNAEPVTKLDCNIAECARCCDVKESRSDSFLAEVQANLTGTLMASRSDCSTSVSEHACTNWAHSLLSCSSGTVCNGVNSWTPLFSQHYFLVISCQSFFPFQCSFRSHHEALRQLVLASVCVTRSCKMSNDAVFTVQERTRDFVYLGWGISGLCQQGCIHIYDDPLILFSAKTISFYSV